MKTVLFINSIQVACGVFQFGKRVFDILKKSKNYNVIYWEPASMEDYYVGIADWNPVAIIYNWHESTLPWFQGCKNPSIKHYGIVHEGSLPDNLNFDYYLTPDCTFSDTDKMFSLPRPLFEAEVHMLAHREAKADKIPVISSWGFAFGNKGLGRIVKTVNDQFDEAIIRLHLPFAYYGDRDESSREKIYPGCQAEVKKSGIKLEITNNFLSDIELLQFLADSDLNIFLYDDMPGRGLSSVIDYALSVPVPIAISNTWMFRHIRDAQPSICVENRSLHEIIGSGSEVLQQYRDKWSNENLIKKVEQILNQTL